MRIKWGDWGAIGQEIGAISKPRHLFLSSIYGDKTKESERNISIHSLDP